jgi:adenylate kinase
MKAVIFLGAPGSGKGTVAVILSQKWGYVHLSSGDLLRETVKSDSEIARQAKRFMERGELVPDDILVPIIELKLQSIDKRSCCIFDGFPRTLKQADTLDEVLARRGAKVDKVILLEVSQKVLLQRLGGRRVCKVCGANYHLINRPPKQPGKCDLCGGDLYQRPDDTEETILKRLEVYNKDTEPLIKRYSDRNLLERINSDKEGEVIAEEIRSILVLNGC